MKLSQDAKDIIDMIWKGKVDDDLEAIERVLMQRDDLVQGRRRREAEQSEQRSSTGPPR